MTTTELYAFSCEGVHGTGRVVLQQETTGGAKTDAYTVVSYARVTGYDVKPSAGHPFHTTDFKKAKAEYTARINMIQGLVGAKSEAQK